MSSAVTTFEKITSSLTREIKWLEEVIERRMNIYQKKTYHPSLIFEDGRKGHDYSTSLPYEPVKTVQPRDLYETLTSYSDFVKRLDLNYEERLLLILTLVPNINPRLLENAFKIMPDDSILANADIGLIRGSNFKGLVPTGFTFLFLIAENLEEKCQAMKYLSSESKLIKQSIIHLETAASGDPYFSGRLLLSAPVLLNLLEVNTPAAPSEK